jgi:hypothetical protein
MDEEKPKGGDEDWWKDMDRWSVDMTGRGGLGIAFGEPPGDEAEGTVRPERTDEQDGAAGDAVSNSAGGQGPHDQDVADGARETGEAAAAGHDEA